MSQQIADATISPSPVIYSAVAMTKPIDSDTELIRRVATEDRVAFEQLFRLYHSRIFKFSMRMLHDHATAEEVACDTLYAVWKSASQFREQSAVSSWILGIAYRLSLKSYKRNARHTDKREPEFQLENLAESSSDVNPEAHTNSAMEVNQIHEALAGLSGDHRAVIELIAMGYSGSEIATIVGCPQNTVKTRTFHARRHLKAALQGEPA